MNEPTLYNIALTTEEAFIIAKSLNLLRETGLLLVEQSAPILAKISDAALEVVDKTLYERVEVDRLALGDTVLGQGIVEDISSADGAIIVTFTDGSADSWPEGFQIWISKRP